MQVNAFNVDLKRRAILLVTVLCAVSASACASPADVELSQGRSYKIIRPIYLRAVYESMDAKHNGKGPAIVESPPRPLKSARAKHRRKAA